MEFAIKFETVSRIRIVHCIYWGSQVIISKNIILLSLKIDFVLGNRADPDEMPLYVAFDLGLHCLPKYPLKGYWSSKA